jgi:hypothetical protein
VLGKVAAEDGSDVSTPGSDASTPGSKVKKTCFTRTEVEAMMVGEKFKKRFCKKKCAECDAACFKRFVNSSPIVAKSMIDTFWCKGCTQLLCESHRHLHKCEQRDKEQAARKGITREQVEEQVKQASLRTAQAEAEAQQEKEQQKEAVLTRYNTMKLRRKTLAGKSNHVSNFIQSLSLKEGPQRAEFQRMYQPAHAINLLLWNEHDSATLPGLADEDYTRLRGLYRRACDMSGLIMTIEGAPLEMRNSWDPQGEDEGEGGAEGGGGGVGGGGGGF